MHRTRHLRPSKFPPHPLPELARSLAPVRRTGRPSSSRSTIRPPAREASSERPSGVEVRDAPPLLESPSLQRSPSSEWTLLWLELRKGISGLAAELKATADDAALEPVRTYAKRYLRMMTSVLDSLICLVEVAREGDIAGELAMTSALTRCVASVYDWSTRLTGEVEEALREEGVLPGDLHELSRHLAEFSAIEVRGFVEPRLAEARAACRNARPRALGVESVSAVLDRLEASVVDLNWELRAT